MGIIFLLLAYLMLFGASIVFRNLKGTPILITQNEQLLVCDVDDTLVVWPESIHRYPYNQSHLQPYEGSRPFKCPYGNDTYHLMPHLRHIEFLKQQKARGYYIIVWSAAGYKWAETIVRELGLEPYVDEVKTKPQKYVDDLSCEKWMGPRIFIK